MLFAWALVLILSCLDLDFPVYNPANERTDSIPIRETAAALKQLLDCGKIKA
jgi:hypothetical protein